MGRIATLGLSALLTVAFIGCSVSDKKLAEYETGIAALTQKGVPDSILSSARVFLAQAVYSKGKSDNSMANASADSCKKEIAKAQAFYTEKAAMLKSSIDSLKSIIAIGRKGLEGYPRKKLDSLAARSDSFAGIGWILQTEQTLKVAAECIPTLKLNSDRGLEVRPELIGSWESEQKSSSETDKKVNAIENKIFTFNADGTALLVEKKKGQSNPRLKEDWEFRSYGTFDLYGDTIFIYVNRFQSVRQNFEERYTEKGKDSWRKKPQPTYDSLITDGSQNRWTAFVDLKTDFKKKK